MSAVLNLNYDQIAQLAEFMKAISKATREHNVSLGPRGRAELMVGNTVIAFAWNDELKQYVLDDRVGGGADGA